MNANLHSPEHMLQIEYIKHPQDYDMGSFHYHNAYELLFLQEGEYTLITMDTAYTICKNQVSLIPPCCMHKSLGRAGNERTLMYFDDRFLNRYFTEKSRSLLLSCFRSGQLPLSPEAFSEALALLFQIRDFVHKNDYDAAYPAFVRILSLLDDSCRENILKTSDAEKREVRKIPLSLQKSLPILIRITVQSGALMIFPLIFISPNIICAAFSAMPPAVRSWTT